MTFAHHNFVRGSSIYENFHPQEEEEVDVIVTIDGVAKIARAGLVAIVQGNARHSVKALTDCQAIIVDLSAEAPSHTRPALEHAKAGEAGTAPRISSSSQFFTYFYPHLTHALFGSSMFLAGLIQVAARIRGSP